MLLREIQVKNDIAVVTSMLKLLYQLELAQSAVSYDEDSTGLLVRGNCHNVDMGDDLLYSTLATYTVTAFCGET